MFNRHRLLLVLALMGSVCAGARADVPMVVAASGHTTVPVSLNGAEPVQFVMDTGASDTVLYQGLADQLKLTLGANAALQGQTGSADLPTAMMPPLMVDGRAKAPFETVILPPRADGVPLAGILGVDVMGAYVVDIDYRGGRFALRDPGIDIARLLRPGAKAIKARQAENGFLYLPVTVGGATGVAVLDTGARRSIVNWRFAQAAGIDPARNNLAPDGVVQGATNNPVAAKRGVLGPVELAGTVRRDFSLRVGDLPIFKVFELDQEPAMILGIDLLESGRIIVDYPTGTVWFDL